jgi:hypothetical protein
LLLEEETMMTIIKLFLNNSMVYPLIHLITIMLVKQLVANTQQL